MSNEKLRILKMVENGTISAEEASKLLTALNLSEAPKKKAKWLKIRIYENNNPKPNVNVSVPLSVAKLAAKIGGKFKISMPENAKEMMKEKGFELNTETFENIDELFDELAIDGRFDLINVVDEKSRTRIEIFVE